METQCYICPRCNDDHEPDEPCTGDENALPAWWQVVRHKDAKIKRLIDAVKDMHDFYEVMHSKDCQCKYCIVVRAAGLDVWKPNNRPAGKE